MSTKEELIKRIEALEEACKPRLWVMTWKTSLWFGLPFGTMWAFGVSPAAAARFALGPYLASWAMILVGAWMATAVTNAAAWWLRADVEKLDEP